jgi:hypothetical protein
MKILYYPSDTMAYRVNCIIAGGDIPAGNDTIDPNAPVVIFDESINAANIARLDFKTP